MLVEYFLHRYATRAGKKFRSIDKRTLDLLQAYDWPGNIRELQNVIERSVILSADDVFSVDELWLSRESSRPVTRVQSSASTADEPRGDREIIEAALAESRGRVAGPSGAAAKLGIPAIDARVQDQGPQNPQEPVQVRLRGLARIATTAKFARFAHARQQDAPSFRCLFNHSDGARFAHTVATTNDLQSRPFD